MNIGSKIKQLRINNNLTQAQLAGDKITRNMLSFIESGKALPSLESLVFIAERLNVPAAFLLSDDDDLFFYQKKEIITKIKRTFSEKKYRECVELINELSQVDDELSYILCLSYFNIGKDAVLSGSLITGKRLIEKCIDYSAKTIYDTSVTEAIASIYYAIAENIQSPLLEFDSKRVEIILASSTECDLYNYLIQNIDHNYSNIFLKKHLNAKEMIKNRRYYEAVNELLEIEKEKSTAGYNSYLMFSIYSDLEVCYRQIADYEHAYRYASKRLILLEAFKS